MHRSTVFWSTVALMFVLMFASLYCDYIVIAGFTVPHIKYVTIHMVLETFMAGLLPVAVFFSNSNVTKKEESGIVFLGVLGDWILNYLYHDNFMFIVPLAIFTTMFLGAFLFSKTVIFLYKRKLK